MKRYFTIANHLLSLFLWTLKFVKKYICLFTSLSRNLCAKLSLVTRWMYSDCRNKNETRIEGMVNIKTLGLFDKWRQLTTFLSIRTISLPIIYPSLRVCTIVHKIETQALNFQSSFSSSKLFRNMCLLIVV